MRNPIVVGNWKMNMSIDAGLKLASSMIPGLDVIQGVEKVICPPFVGLGSIGDMLSGTSVSVGAQNMHYEEDGAFTGEISPAMLSPICKFVIVGHSERRQLFGETDDLVNHKVLAARKVGMKPIVCVGEQLNDRNKDKAKEVVGEQLINGLGNSVTEPILVAYEPVWAIGTNKTPSLEEIENVHSYIKDIFKKKYSTENICVIYGGSVNLKNSKAIFSAKNVDGGLIGGASLKANEFRKIYDNLN